MKLRGGVSPGNALCPGRRELNEQVDEKALKIA
jgi:hypothetical protein